MARNKNSLNWGYTINGLDEIYSFYPSREAALEAAKEGVTYNYDHAETIKVSLYQKVETIEFQVQVVEVPSVIKKTTVTLKGK
jgi:hypothetical protein